MGLFHKIKAPVSLRHWCFYFWWLKFAYWTCYLLGLMRKQVALKYRVGTWLGAPSLTWETDVLQKTSAIYDLTKTKMIPTPMWRVEEVKESNGNFILGEFTDSKIHRLQLENILPVAVSAWYYTRVILGVFWMWLVSICCKCVLERGRAVFTMLHLQSYSCVEGMHVLDMNPNSRCSSCRLIEAAKCMYYVILCY